MAVAHQSPHRISHLPTNRDLQSLVEAVASTQPVSGLTHCFYRYPARFSPDFARKAIEAFTDPGDFVLDPFAGGGTSVVEALALGRRVVGNDINRLSGFLARVKTTPLTRCDVEALLSWRAGLYEATNLRSQSGNHDRWRRYQKHLPWWLRKTLELALDFLGDLKTSRQRRFARCSLMRTAQWALDCRAALPTRDEFLQRHRLHLEQMLSGMREFRAALQRSFEQARVSDLSRRLITGSADELGLNRRYPHHWGAPRLILTSPPYPGVHILYHRWQVRGRRETAAPYWLANCLDGRPNSYYTFVERRRRDLELYLAPLRTCFRSLVALMDDSSVLAQLVAFSRPAEQVRPYLEALREVGLEEISFGGSVGGSRLVTRTVPNRKWYADAQGDLGASCEYLLIHRKVRP